MIKTKIQHFCISNNIAHGHFDGIEVYPRLVREKNKAIYSYNNHFCLIWKTDGVHFDKTIEEKNHDLQ